MIPEIFIDNINSDAILDENSFQYPTPDKIKIELKPHQKAVLYRAKQIEDSNGYEILKNSLLLEKDPKLYSELCSLTPEQLNEKIKSREKPSTNYSRIGQFYDNVGAGKSLEALSLIASGFNYKSKELIKTHHQTRFKKIKYINEDYDIIPINYLLVPHNLIKQWENYICSQTSLKYIKFDKLKKTKEITKDDLIKLLGDFKYDIILVSSTNHNILIDKLSSTFLFNNDNKIFARLIVDELHTMKLPSGNGIHSFYFIWAISATNSLSASHTGLLGDTAYNIAISYQMGQNRIRCNTNFVKKSFELPEPISETVLCKARKIFNIMSSVLSPHIQDMLKKDDIKGVMEALGIETFSEKNLINNITQDIQERIDNLKIDLESAEKKKYKNQKEQEEIINKINLKIKEEEDKIKSIEDRVKAEDMDPITYSPIENPVLTPCCKNKYDLDSILNWFKHSNKNICPMCRALINPKKLIHIKDIDTDEEVEVKQKPDKKQSKVYDTKEHNKIENLDYILKNKIPHNSSILIFSDHESKFNEIKDIVEKNNRGELKQLIGQGSYISKLIEEYKQGKRQVLFLNARFYGSGLNLENTEYIILMHKMSSDTELQVIGRAQRPGRTTQLKIIKVYYENE